MKEILKRLFQEKTFDQGESKEKIDFYYRKLSTEREFFFIQYILADKQSGEELQEEMSFLENEFLNNVKDLRNSFMNQLSAENKIQFDKNLSLILVLQINSFENLDKYKNYIYAVEESPLFFKKNVLIYTQEQLVELKKCLNNSEQIENELNNQVKNMNGYDQLYKNEKYPGLYSLVIRLFSKIPFLNYKFSKPISSESLERKIEESLKRENYFSNILTSIKKNINEMPKINLDNTQKEKDILKELEKQEYLLGKKIFDEVCNQIVISDEEIQRELNRLIGDKK